MQNDVLKNNIAPWQEKGRWYHGVYDATNLTFISEKTDEFIKDSFELIQVPNTYVAVLRAKLNQTPDVKFFEPISASYKCSGVVVPSTTSAPHSYYQAAGRRGIVVGPAGANSGISEFWVFVVYNTNNE